MIPAVIYGGNQPPIAISLPTANCLLQDPRRRLLHHRRHDRRQRREDPRASRATISSIRSATSRCMSTSCASRRTPTITVDVPVQFINESQAPGIKRGGVLNVVRHRISLICPVDAIPEKIVADLTGLDINDSLHISHVTLPEGVRPTIKRDFTIATIAAPAGVKEELRAAAEAAAGRQGRADGRCRGAAAEGAAGRSGLRPGRRSGRRPGRRQAGGRQEVVPALGATRGEPTCSSSSASAIPARNMPRHRHNVGFMAVDAIHRRHGFSPWRRRFQGEVVGRHAGRREGAAAQAADLHERVRPRGSGEAVAFYKLAPATSLVIHDEVDLPPGKTRMKAGGGAAGHNGLRSIDARASATATGACASASAIPASRRRCRTTCCTTSPRPTRPG